MPKSKDNKSPLFRYFIFSLLLHGTLIGLIIFRGFDSPATIKKPDMISGRIITLANNGATGSSKSVKPEQKTTKQIQKKPVSKPQRAEKPKEKVKETKPVVKTEPKEPPKPREKKEEEVVKQEPEKKDVIDLSEKKKPEPKKEPEKPKPVKQVAKKEDAVKKRQEFLNELQNKKSKEDILSELKRNTENKQIAASDTDSYDITTPSGKPGTPSGINSAMVSLYADAVGREIASNWNIPPNIPTDGRLMTKVFFRSNENGEVFDLRIEESSGNTSFDEFCLRAIKKASPLKTPPPPEILQQTEGEGIEVSFRNDPA